MPSSSSTRPLLARRLRLRCIDPDVVPAIRRVSSGSGTGLSWSASTMRMQRPDLNSDCAAGPNWRVCPALSLKIDQKNFWIVLFISLVGLNVSVAFVRGAGAASGGGPLRSVRGQNHFRISPWAPGRVVFPARSSRCGRGAGGSSGIPPSRTTRGTQGRRRRRS